VSFEKWQLREPKPLKGALQSAVMTTYDVIVKVDTWADTPLRRCMLL
jgi:hypothetical protein